MKKIANKIIKAAIGAQVALLSLVGPVLAQAGKEPTKLQVTEPTSGGGKGIGVTDIGVLLRQGLSMAMIIAAILTFAYLIWGGIQWVTSGGDKAAYEEARNRITAALVGLAIVVSAWALMAIIGYFFGVNITDSISWPTAAS